LSVAEVVRVTGHRAPTRGADEFQTRDLEFLSGSLTDEDKPDTSPGELGNPSVDSRVRTRPSGLRASAPERIRRYAKSAKRIPLTLPA
jgi:hypothetical protein